MGNKGQFVIVGGTLGLVALVVWPETEKAWADLGEGRAITLQGQPLSGFHSDWSRQLVISDGWARETVTLFEDTGWWKGSALYRDAKGGYVLDDGIDRILFTLCPLNFAPQASQGGAMNPATGKPPAPGCAPGPLETDAPPSRYHAESAGLRFLGLFVETHPGLAFKTWREVVEPRPDSIDACG